jgi:hypothetical protein
MVRERESETDTHTDRQTGRQWQREILHYNIYIKLSK